MRRRCIGFVRPHRSRNGWLRCEKHSLAGDRFCSTHRDALDGAFLGLFRKYGIFRDDQYTETQTEGDLSQNGQRPFDRRDLPELLTPPAAAAVRSRQNPQSASATARKCPTHKRVRIGDALRRSGVDEWAVANGYVDVLGKLTRKSNDNDGVQKLFVDVLKEVSRHLEPPRAEASPDAPVIVKLVHNVSRPARTPTHIVKFTIPRMLFEIFGSNYSRSVMTMTTNATSSKIVTIGYIVQLGGIASFTLGAIFSVHHIAIGASFIGGAVAFYVGEKLRALT